MTVWYDQQDGRSTGQRSNSADSRFRARIRSNRSNFMNHSRLPHAASHAFGANTAPDLNIVFVDGPIPASTVRISGTTLHCGDTPSGYEVCSGWMVHTTFICPSSLCSGIIPLTRFLASSFSGRIDTRIVASTSAQYIEYRRRHNGRSVERSPY